MTPEQQTAATIAQAQADAARLLAQYGPAILDGWRMTLETLEGLVAITVQAGWPEPIARQMVAAQFIANAAAQRPERG